MPQRAAATVLNTGDITILGFDSDTPDGFAFVTGRISMPIPSLSSPIIVSREERPAGRATGWLGKRGFLDPGVWW